MKFNFEKYKGKYVMHCKTLREKEQFCKVMHDNGRIWSSGDSYLDKNNYSSTRNNNIYYYFNEGFQGITTPSGVHVLEWEDFMEFTKADLKAGYVVQYRDGEYRMIMPSQKGLYLVLGKNGCGMYLDNFNEDLTSFNKEGVIAKCTIIAVFGYNEQGSNSLDVDWTYRPLLWSRKEPPMELTMQEIADKFGVDVKDLKIKK